ADQGERLGALRQRRIGQAAFVLMLIVSERSAADGIERVEPAYRLQLVLEVAEHEADEAFGFAPLLACGVAALDRGNGERAGHRHSGERASGEPGQLAMAPRRFALDQVVEADTQHPGDELQERKSLALAVGPEIRRQGLCALGRRPAAAIELLPEGRRKALLVFPPGNLARERLAADNRGKHAGIRPIV